MLSELILLFLLYFIDINSLMATILVTILIIFLMAMLWRWYCLYEYIIRKILLFWNKTKAFYVEIQYVTVFVVVKWRSIMLHCADEFHVWHEVNQMERFFPCIFLTRWDSGLWRKISSCGVIAASHVNWCIFRYSLCLFPSPVTLKHGSLSHRHNSRTLLAFYPTARTVF